ncbi:hypothetical protein GCM10027186_46570 [Micromonospora schwarzwaldensis]
MPAPAARTSAPGAATRSTPRCPGSQGRGGGSNRRATRGGPGNGHRKRAAAPIPGTLAADTGRPADEAAPAGAGRRDGSADGPGVRSSTSSTAEPARPIGVAMPRTLPAPPGVRPPPTSDAVDGPALVDDARIRGGSAKAGPPMLAA